MVRRAPARVLLALRPTVLEGAFDVLLSASDASVVRYDDSDGGVVTGSYDVAVVTAGVVAVVESDVLIVLPDTDLGDRLATVIIGAEAHTVPLDSNGAVIALLASHLEV